MAPSGRVYELLNPAVVTRRVPHFGVSVVFLPFCFFVESVSKQYQSPRGFDSNLVVHIARSPITLHSRRECPTTQFLDHNGQMSKTST